jgi:hypothetical protein
MLCVLSLLGAKMSSFCPADTCRAATYACRACGRVDSLMTWRSFAQTARPLLTALRPDPEIPQGFECVTYTFLYMERL